MRYLISGAAIDAHPAFAIVLLDETNEDGLLAIRELVKEYSDRATLNGAESQFAHAIRIFQGLK